MLCTQLVCCAGGAVSNPLRFSGPATKEKARSNTTWPLVKVCLRTDNSLLSYFEYPCVELAAVEDVSFFCAQAPKLKALAKTATIMIAFKNFN